MRFRSPDCNAQAQVEPPKFIGDARDEKARAQYTWRVKRNGVNEKRELVGYGVVTGEPEALLYVASGTFTVLAGDLVAVLTDGFKDYMKLPEFISIFKNWHHNLGSQIKKFTATRIDKAPEKFGDERSLIMISI